MEINLLNPTCSSLTLCGARRVGYMHNLILVYYAPCTNKPTKIDEKLIQVSDRYRLQTAFIEIHFLPVA